METSDQHRVRRQSVAQPIHLWAVMGNLSERRAAPKRCKLCRAATGSQKTKVDWGKSDTGKSLADPLDSKATEFSPTHFCSEVVVGGHVVHQQIASPRHIRVVGEPEVKPEGLILRCAFLSSGWLQFYHLSHRLARSLPSRYCRVYRGFVTRSDSPARGAGACFLHELSGLFRHEHVLPCLPASPPP